MGTVTTIERAGDDDADPRFLHALLCHVGLPRSAVAERTFVRTAGNVSILLEAGHRRTGTGFEPQPLPYGSRPRLALVHICSEAVRTKRREIDIGRSTRAFLGSIHTWGDGQTWAMWVGCRSAQHWTWTKKTLAFCTVAQDGEDEGCLRLHALPRPEQAKTLRETLGIRKRVEYSPDVVERLRKMGPLAREAAKATRVG